MRYWITCLARILFLVLLTVCKVSADPICNGSYSELITPKLYHDGIPIDLNTSQHYSSLTLIFSWRKQPVNIILEQRTLIPDDSVVEVHEDDESVKTEALWDNRTHYQGHVLGASFSFVALAVGNYDMAGYVQFNGEGIFIEPVSETSIGVPVGQHEARSCGKETYQRGQYRGTTGRQSVKRIRRAPSQYTKFLEVLLVADSTVVESVGKNRVQTYLLTLMNIVNEVYHDHTLGVNIEVVTVKIIYMDKSTEGHVIVTSDPQRTVDQFCYWASTQSYRARRYARQTAGSNHDAAVLLTRHKFTAAGYAPITGMCVPMRNCAFVKDDGFTSAFVIAHEVGHIFGLFHDGHGNNCYGRAYTTSIMATMVQSAFNRYWWSGCSKQRMQEVIGSLTCLNNNPHHVITENLPDPVGIGWSLDEQCMFEFGKRARRCSIFGANDPCAQMWCSDGYAYQCKTKNVIPLDGTQCGPTSQWYCESGACGYHGNERPVNGNWGQWSEWSNCSAECGVGFKRRSRICDSPKPKFGGKDCDGESENVDTCKAELLLVFVLWTCSHYEDARAYQCSIMDIVPVQGSTHIWLPYQVDKLSDRCKLTCISQSTNKVVTFDSLVDNGTPCSYDDYNSICIDGKCQDVGCDGVRGSKVKEDRCGICQGDGKTCKTVSGIYSKKFEYSAAGPFYETMLVLPKGSRDISIAETSVSPHFLSVQDTVYFKHVINKDGRQGTSRNFVLEGAWFKYNNNGGYEKLDVKGPIQRNVNVMIYPTNWQKPANVRYSYVVDKNDYTYEKNKYQWKFEDWSDCSVTCGNGVQHIIYGCYDKENGKKVDSDSCKFIKNPNTDNVECIRPDCSSFLYLWRMLRGSSECSETCGEDGVQYMLYECEEKETQEKVADAYCSHIPEPKIEIPCNRFPCTAVSYRWDVTSDWSECTASCGDTGTQHQLFYCVRITGEDKEEKVAERFCSDMVSPKEPRPCNRVPCLEYRWKVTDEWYDCNATCGDKGHQRKKVVCAKHEIGETEKVVGIWYCGKQEKPSEMRTCNVRKCFTYQWEETGEWSECSKTCGVDAVRVMTYYCKNVTYDSRETHISDRFCDIKDKPRLTANCSDIISCDTFEWNATDIWTQCSAPCGVDGIRTRVYKCVSIRAEEEVADSLCQSSTKFIEEEACNRFSCQTFELHYVDEWFPECQQKCGDTTVTFQTRKTQCFEVFDNGQRELTDGEFCLNVEKPSLMLRPCKSPVCSVYAWEESGWSKCSETCGAEGIETQTVECIETMDNGSRNVVDDAKCADARKLDLVQRPCRMPSCLSYSMKSDWSPCPVTCGVGIQTREVTCVRKSSNGSEIEVKLEMCEDANITKPQQQCNKGPCGFMEWGAGPWSRCSKTCGLGIQKREVYCGEQLQPSDSSMCPGLQPKELRNCQLAPCRVRFASRCRGDRAVFCRKANNRLCNHVAYKRVCCVSCGQLQQDQPRFRYRNYWDYRRRYFRRLG